MNGKIFSEELIGMTAMTVGGYLLGTVDGLVFDTVTGELRYALIKLRGTPKKGQKMDAAGRAVVDFDDLKIGEKSITVI
jgi:sporulation protein YlmC with PRC-barrel domain